MDVQSHQDSSASQSVIVMCDKKQKDANVSITSISSSPEKSNCEIEDESDVQFLGKTPKLIQDSLQEIKSQCDKISDTMLTNNIGVRINDLKEIISDLKKHADLETPQK